jgi:hypothetical protein
VAEGIQVAQKISTATANANAPAERIVIRSVTIRDKPAPMPDPFSTESVAELSKMRVAAGNLDGEHHRRALPGQGPESCA